MRLLTSAEEGRGEDRRFAPIARRQFAKSQSRQSGWQSRIVPAWALARTTSPQSCRLQTTHRAHGWLVTAVQNVRARDRQRQVVRLWNWLGRDAQAAASQTGWAGSPPVRRRPYPTTSIQIQIARNAYVPWGRKRPCRQFLLFADRIGVSHPLPPSGNANARVRANEAEPPTRASREYGDDRARVCDGSAHDVHPRVSGGAPE